MSAVRWADLHVVTVTAERRSLSAAARALGCSPSAVSQSVRRVERHLGLTLFQRHPHQVAPTAAGRALLGIVDEIWSTWTNTVAQAAALDNGRLPALGPDPGARTREVTGRREDRSMPPDASATDAFLLTVDTGSFAAAARRLYLTPRSVSARVAQIERSMRLRLLDRTTHGVVVTAAGRAVADGLSELSSRWQEASASLQVSCAAPAALMPDELRMSVYSLAVHTLLDHLDSRWPATIVNTREYDPDRAFGGLLDRTVDIVIGYEVNDPMPPPPAPVRRVRMVTEHCQLAVGKGHVLQERLSSADGTLKLSELSGQMWVLPPNGPLRELVEKACAAAGFAPRCGHAVTDVSAVRGLLTSLRAITFCAPTVPTFDELRLLPVDGAPTRTLFLAWNSEALATPVVRECAAAVLEWYRERARMNNPDYARFLAANPQMLADTSPVLP
ncbi:LysR family transcriptional regulator [Micromonospora sp. R77]|uniref:LysR family transcriptional regulator n=1 Tax=Micromonospora sp. R77 TaxID=2925836 RepID=UPI001F603564|nr:LysR family transcriptional regulator [Micromonospora sp. R77]MCI4066327.1 LysR family transcriptional regulator [Micromonospora sp. R77]